MIAGRKKPFQTHDPVREAVELVNADCIFEAESFLFECSDSPNHPAATRCQLALLALEIENPRLALRLMRTALDTAPLSPEVRFVAGVTDRALGRLSEAREHFSFARPESNPNAAYYLSLVQESLGDPVSARDSIGLALAQNPQDADYLNQSACIAARLGDFDEALSLSGQALRAEPGSAGFAFNHAQNLLLAGRAREAWPLFEARLAFTPEHLHPGNGSAAWEGQPLNGKTLLVWHEQGLGDSIQFSRFLPSVASRAGKVLFRCQPSLAGLFSSSLPGIEILSSAEKSPHTDFHAPLLSLPGLLGANLDAPPPSIFPAHNSAASLQRIGFACAGNPNHPDDAARSLSLELFKPLFGNRFEWLCLQKNLRPSEALPPGIPHPGAAFSDFIETARALASMDLVISADTAIAHLSASLGKPTWFLLPLCPDWRWGRTGNHTPWYPSARLFRQHEPGNWKSVIKKIATQLIAPWN
ncbi:MAG: tetratricopeptide repeat protein [Spartobacteria bacterium]